MTRIIDPIEADTVRRIFAESRDGRGDKTIAKQLTTEKVPSPSGGNWDSNAVWQILNRTDYHGIVTTDRTRRVFRMKSDPVFGNGLFEGKQKGEAKTQPNEALRIVDEHSGPPRTRADRRRSRRGYARRTVSCKADPRPRASICWPGSSSARPAADR